MCVTLRPRIIIIANALKYLQQKSILLHTMQWRGRYKAATIWATLQYSCIRRYNPVKRSVLSATATVTTHKQTTLLGSKMKQSPTESKGAVRKQKASWLLWTSHTLCPLHHHHYCHGSPHYHCKIVTWNNLAHWSHILLAPARVSKCKKKKKLCWLNSTSHSTSAKKRERS